MPAEAAQALKVQLGKVACLQALPANIEFFPEVVQVIVGKLLRCLGDDEVGEGLTYREDSLLLLGMVLSVGLGRCGTRAVEAPAALLSALEQTGDAHAVVVGIIGVLTERDVRTSDDQVRVLPHACLEFLCFDREQVLLRREQYRVLYARQVNRLLHGDGHVSRRRLILTIPNPGEQQDAGPSEDNSTTLFRQGTAFRLNGSS